MAKKAFLVTFEVTTRVVADVPEEFNLSNYNLITKKDAQAFDTIIKQARDNILEVPEYYIYGDNAEITEDIECLYDSNTEE